MHLNIYLCAYLCGIAESTQHVGFPLRLKMPADSCRSLHAQAGALQGSGKEPWVPFPQFSRTHALSVLMFSHLWDCNLFSPFEHSQGALFSLQILSLLHVLRVTCFTQIDVPPPPRQYDVSLMASSMRGLQLAPVLEVWGPKSHWPF